MNYIYNQEKNIDAPLIFFLDRHATRCSIGLPGMEMAPTIAICPYRVTATTKNETGV
jgi:hypothetical protein